MTLKNYTIYSSDHSGLQRLAEEYKMLGRYVKLELELDKLTVLALKPVKPKPKKQEDDTTRDNREVEE
jgi:hypothetical protein